MHNRGRHRTQSREEPRREGVVVSLESICLNHLSLNSLLHIRLLPIIQHLPNLFAFLLPLPFCYQSDVSTDVKVTKYVEYCQENKATDFASPSVCRSLSALIFHYLPFSESVVFCTIFDRGCCRWFKTPRGAEQVGLFSDDSDDGQHEWRLPRQPGGKKDPPNAKQHQSAGTQWPWAAWPEHSRSAHTHFVSLTFTLECWHSLAFGVRMSWWHRHHIYLP